MFLTILIFGYFSLFLPIILVTSNVGGPLIIFFDPMSLMIVPLAPYLVTTGITKKFSFDETALKLFENLCIGFSIIAVIAGVIIILYGWGEWDSTNFYKNLGTSLVITVIPLLYALICKYLIVLPLIANKKKTNS